MCVWDTKPEQSHQEDVPITTDTTKNKALPGFVLLLRQGLLDPNDRASACPRHESAEKHKGSTTKAVVLYPARTRP